MKHLWWSFVSISQKFPSSAVLTNRCSGNMQQIYGRTPMPKCDFNEVVMHLYWNHTLAWVSFVNLLSIFRRPFPKNNSGELLLRSRKSFIIDIWQGPKYGIFKKFSDDRSSPPEVFCKKGVLRNFVKFTGKHLCQSLFFNNTKFLRTSFFIEHLRRLILWWES